MSITVSNISKGYGGRTLFRDVNVTFNRGVNYGLTGPNGSGKSTFMKLLIGAEDTDSGTVKLPQRTGWLRQDHTVFDEFRVIDTVIMGNPRLWKTLERREELYAKGDDLSEDEGVEIGDLEMIVAEEDGYMAEADAAILLEGLGIGQDQHERKIAELQGGLKVRVLLAQALFGQPEALLLDEPTNSLDLDSIVWLEEFLLKFDGVLVVISHDRRFLNAVCDEIADIDFEAIMLYPGNYDDMVRTKANVRNRVEKEAGQREKKIAQLSEFIQRFKAGTRSSQTRSRAKQIQRLRPDEVKRSNIARPFIRFPIGEDQSGRDVLTVRDLSHSYGDNVIFTGFHTDVQRGDKVAVLGKNGIGKSTLLKALLDPANIESGKVRWGHNTRIGTFLHNHREHIEAGTTVFDWLVGHRPEVGQENVRAILGRMLFSGQDGKKPTTTLSGGEAARLSMCYLILMEFNVLVLDEPTDHLDLESISALREAIAEYKGTVIYVTHDRDLASAANRIWSYPEPGVLLDYAGGVDEYLKWYQEHAS